MASQSPVEYDKSGHSNPPAGSPGDPSAQEYSLGWATLSRLLQQGASWSGTERNNCFVNAGAGRFAEASYISGLDFADDGRALVAVDWDDDGDLDLWFKNRSGPQLRFMRNQSGGDAAALSLWLVGTEANRDAVGARVELRTPRNRYRRSVVAGDGYLSQSSRWLHFGLGSDPSVDEVAVHWPGGTVERFDGVDGPGRYRLVQGTGLAKKTPLRRVELARAAVPKPEPPASLRVLLKTPLPMPPRLTELQRPGRALLVNLWAEWCGPCRHELVELAQSHAALDSQGIDLLALNSDSPEGRARAERFFIDQVRSQLGEAGSTSGSFDSEPVSVELLELIQAIVAHVRAGESELPLPTSLLIDAQGSLQLIYLGATTQDQLVADAQAILNTPMQGAKRSLFPGRWYYRSPRDLEALAVDLRQRGQLAPARFYEALSQR